MNTALDELHGWYYVHHGYIYTNQSQLMIQWVTKVSTAEQL
jgi:hypothetical protein